MFGTPCSKDEAINLRGVCHGHAPRRMRLRPASATRVDQPARVSVCHCLACERRTGSAFSFNARFADNDVSVQARSSEFTRIGKKAGASASAEAFAAPSFPPPFLPFFHETGDAIGSRSAPNLSRRSVQDARDVAIARSCWRTAANQNRFAEEALWNRRRSSMANCGKAGSTSSRDKQTFVLRACRRWRAFAGGHQRLPREPR
jgi:hypothetical protein